MTVHRRRWRRGAARWGAPLAVMAVVMAVWPGGMRAQDAAVRGAGMLDRPAQLEVRGITLDAALRELARRSGVPLAWSPDLVAGRSSVSCACTRATVRQALDTLLVGTGLEYLEAGRRVVVGPSPRRSTAPDAGGAAPDARVARRHPAGTLVVEVTGETDGVPVGGAEVDVSGHVARWRTDAAGRVRTPLPADTYEVGVRALGFSTARFAGVAVSDGESTTVSVRLRPAPVALTEVVVTPGTYGLIAEEGATSSVALSREEVENTPHVFEDVYRAVNRLPGVTSADYGVRLDVRGAPNDQILVLLDGLELYEPFHLRELDGGMFSVVDVETVADVSLVTGGFGAEHGDRLGGVFSLRTATPARTSTTLGASIQNLTARSQGVFAGGRGAWLASARRGFLDLVLGLVGKGDEPVSPTYYDGFAKVQYQLGTGHLLSGHVLYAGDDLAVNEDDATEFSSRWSDGYAWLSWDAALGGTVDASTVLSAGRVTRRRSGSDWRDPATRILEVADRSTYEFVGLKQDWSAAASRDWVLKWGFDLRSGRAGYDYRVWRRRWDPNQTDPAAPSWVEVVSESHLTPRRSGAAVGVYVANRVRPVSALAAEAGLRFDYHSHTGDRSLAPRLSVAWQLGRGLTLRSAWGLYYQSQKLPYLQVADLDTLFQPAQRAEHRVVGVERRLGAGTTVRLEAYERRVRHPWREYRSLQPIFEVLPEQDPMDRELVVPARARARGVELLARREGASLSWTASYALAVSEEEVAGAWVPRPHDQRHTFRAEVAWRPSERWSLSCAWQYHSPWPYTEYSWAYDTTATGEGYFYPVRGALNAGRLPPYHRLDARLTRHFQAGGGRLSVYLDAFNLYNRRNAFIYRSDPVGVVAGRVVTQRQLHDIAGLLPTLGARWEF